MDGNNDIQPKNIKKDFAETQLLVESTSNKQGAKNVWDEGSISKTSTPTLETKK